MILLHSPADVVAELLGGIIPTFVASEPPEPDRVATVYNTAWRSDGRSMIDGEGWYHHGIQVRIRGLSPPSTFADAEAVRDHLLRGVYDALVALDGAVYKVHCFSRATLIDIGLDAPKSMRYLCTVNADVALGRVS